MKSSVVFASVFALFLLTACEELNNVLPSLTDSEKVQGLKETLIVGTDTASTQVSRVNGYLNDALIKIVFPPEAQQARQILISAGFTSLVTKLEQQLNRSAEEAAKRSLPIFTRSITSMSISDATGIIAGADTAATNYLRRTTTTPLKSAYQPVIDSVLQQPLILGSSAQDTWSAIVTNYNRLTILTNDPPLNTNLAEYTTDRALHGLFLKVRDQERLIRQDPQRQVTEAIRKIFKK